MVADPALSYSVVNRGLRPARVAIVFDGGDNWSYWARRALYLANQVWGGAGFALVPQRDGGVDPVLLRACRAFDPDYVVVFPQELVEFEYFAPGALHARGPADETLTGTERWNALSLDVAFQGEPRPGDKDARDLVASVCSPYLNTGGDEPFEEVAWFDGPAEELPAAADIPGVHTAHVLHCPPSWGGLIGAAVASHAGIAMPPNPAAVEPELDEGVLNQLTSWLLQGAHPHLPYELVYFPNDVSTSILTEESKLAHERTMAGLATIASNAPVPRQPAVAVLGDTVEDFALARLLQLTYGGGAWLPTFLGTEKETLPSRLSSGLFRVAAKTRGQRRRLTLTSVSRPLEDLYRFEERLRIQHDAVRHGGSEEPDISWSTRATNLAWPRTHTTHLGIVEQFDDALPVPTTTDSTGTRAMVTPLPPPALQDPALAGHQNLAWHVDVSWASGNSILGRGVRGHELFAPATDPHLTLARSSRAGISYRASRSDLVPTGVQSVNRLARPALRDLSLSAFVAAKATEHNMTIRVSDAGQRTAQLSRMLGGREQFINLFGGPLLPALHALVPTSSSNNTAYPDGDGVALRIGDGVLSFPGICARAADSTPEQVRDQVDAALRAGVLRRGLVLRCQVCQTKQLQTIDDLGQRWLCERCAGDNDLDRRTWHVSTEEPTWFYGLHPVGQHLLQDHGDVPALLAAYLSKSDQGRTIHYQDATELEFMEDKHPRVEADLIAYRDDVLIVAECKSSDNLGGGDKEKRKAEILKKCQAAVWLQADQLVFATTSSTWKKSAKDAIRGIVPSHEGWPALGVPTVILIAGLGSTAATTETLLLRATL